jgi:hypothetical protein
MARLMGGPLRRPQIPPLQGALTESGLQSAATAPPIPRLGTLQSEYADHIMSLFRALGGTAVSPSLHPGQWDLALEGGLVVELDEELHFNRYRRLTLEPAWTRALPWRDDYMRYTSEHETECLGAAQWGRRWTSPSCESLFGPAAAPGAFDSNGAPRWKQRALYDAMKDAAAVSDRAIRLARVSTVDVIGGVRLGAVLEGRAKIDLSTLRNFVAHRSTGH